MHKLTLILAPAFLVACNGMPGSNATRPLEIDSAKMMQEYMALGMPGPEHQELAKQVGTWKTIMRHREGPGSPWMEMHGTATYKSIFGGRFVMASDKGAFEMEGQKMEHESMMIMGYDKLQKEWTSRYYSSMSTWCGDLRGKKNAKGEIIYRGLVHDNITPKGRPTKAISRWDGDDKMVFEMFDSIGGKMIHIMTWTAERAK